MWRSQRLFFDILQREEVKERKLMCLPKAGETSPFVRAWVKLLADGLGSAEVHVRRLGRLAEGILAWSMAHPKEALKTQAVASSRK